MRISKAIILGVSLLFCLNGCGNDKETLEPTVSNKAQPSVTQQQSPENNEDQVIVSRTLRLGQVNAKPYGTFSKKEEIAVFEEAVKSADKMQGILDVAESDYDVVWVESGKKKEFHLWVNSSDQYGMFIYVSETEQGYRLTKQSTRELYDLIGGLKYSSEQAAANGDVVNLHGQVLNSDVWSKFVSNVKSGSEDEVQVVQYTIEGDPIFNNLTFDGEAIRNVYDSTHDHFGTPIKRYAFCNSLEEKTSDQGTEYKLASCGEQEDKESWFSLLIP